MLRPEQIYFKSYDYARGLGFPEDDAFEFASWRVVRWLEGKGRKQELGQALTDYLRECHAKQARWAFAKEHDIPARPIPVGHSIEWVLAPDDTEERDSNAAVAQILGEVKLWVSAHEMRVLIAFMNADTKRDAARALKMSESQLGHTLARIRKKLTKLGFDPKADRL